MNFFVDIFQYDFLVWGLLGSLLLSWGCALASPFIIGQRLSFMGSALAHSTLLAVGVAYLLVGGESWGALYITTLMIVAVMALVLAIPTWKGELPADAVIGIFLAASMALGLILHQKFLKGVTDLSTLLIGDLLLLNPVDLIPLSIVVLIWTLILAKNWRAWAYWSYDPQGAQLSGLPVRSMHVGLYLLTSALVVSVVKMAGVLALEGLLLIPGFFSLKLARSMAQSFPLALGLALVSAPIGMSLTYQWDLPTAPGLVLTQICLAGLGLGLKRLMAKK